MATETVRDHRDNPCKFTEACEYFGGIETDGFRELDPRDLRRTIGAALLDLKERMATMGDSLSGICIDGDDDDGARALVNLVEEYNLKTSSRFFDLARNVLAALCAEAAQGVAHG